MSDFSRSPVFSRLPAIFLLFAHGSLFLLRTPLVMMLPHPPGMERVFGSIWLTVLSSEALLFTISIAFILMAVTLSLTIAANTLLRRRDTRVST